MARIRTVKPEFFKNYKLYKAEQDEGLPLRLAFEGLWTVADREGRFEWIPEQIKVDALPYDDVDFSRVLDALWTRGYVEKYEVDGVVYGWIPGFATHQVINNREKESILPEPNENNILTRGSRVDDASLTRIKSAQVEGKGKEGKGREQADGAGAPAPARRKKSDSMTVDDFIAECKANGEQAIPDDDPVIAYCTDAGIPHEFVYLAWREFVDRYRASGKRQKGVRGWRQTFLNCVRGNWYELWAIGNDGYFLTKQGKQAQLAHKEAA